MRLLRRLAYLLRLRSNQDDLRDELAFHRDMVQEDATHRGASPDAAHAEARRAMGNETLMREEARAVWLWPWLEARAQDVRYTVRTLLRNRSFAVVLILTLALSTGANTAIFSVAEGVLLRPLPYPDDDQLVEVWSTGGKVGTTGHGPLSWQQIQHLDALHRNLSAIAGFAEARYNLTGNGDPLEVQATIASSLFEVLRVPAALGRTLGPSDFHEPVAVLSHGLWLQVFGGDAGAIGRAITLDGKAFTIVGVMPASFAFPDEGTGVWLPMGQAFDEQPEIETNPDYQSLHTVGRLREGSDVTRLTADLSLIAKVQTEAQELQPKGYAVSRLRDEVAGNTRTPLLILLAVVGFVLVIGCVNAAGLLLARSSARQREFAVRRALGASRGRLMAQLLTESVVLALAGGALGILIAKLGVSAILAAWPAVLPRTHQIGIDVATMAYALLISLVAGIAFGLAPAWRSSGGALEQSLRQGSATTTTGRRRHRLQRALVVSEIALAMVVLTGAGLLVRSFIRLRSVDPGYEVHGVLAARVRLDPERFATDATQRDFFQSVIDGLRLQPGVESASMSRTLPMNGEIQGFRISTHDVRPDDPEPFLNIDQGIVGPEFFRALRIPILAGRAFTDNDRDNSQQVAIVNESLAKRLWPHESPIGRAWPLRGGTMAIIVGEIGDIHYASLTDPVRPEAYLPFSQAASRGATSAWIVARATRDPLALASAVRTAIGRVDRRQPVSAFTTLNELLGRSTAARSFNMTLVSIFALLALGLAVVGIYGVTAYAVQQRTQEIGVRIALGAARRNVLRLILAETAVMTAIGIVIGILGAIGFTRVLESLLFEMSATDVVTFALTTLVLAAAALVAALLPALRATRIDPVHAMRSN